MFTRQDGFTLIETLVVISLLALMSVLVFAALKIGSTVWTRNEQSAEVSQDVAVAQSVLRNVIEQAYPALLQRTDGIQSVAFNGTANILELSASLPAEMAIGGYHRIRLAYSDRSSGGNLTMAWRLERNVPRFESLPGPSTTAELLSGVNDVRFAYFGQVLGTDRPDWHDEWTDQQKLPSLVRINVKFKDIGRFWPPLLIAPRIDVDATCVFDLLTRGCQGR